MNQWMVNLPYEDVETMRNATKVAEEEVARLKAQVAKLQLGTDTGDLASELADSLRAALAVIQWAQGNYDPETVRGWPHQALRRVALGIKRLPGALGAELEWADDARQYANMAEVVERARREGRQKELAQIPRSAMQAGPEAYSAAALTLLQQPPQQAGEQAGAESDTAPAPPASMPVPRMNTRL